ncbi:hypothetical protein MRX96_016800 [Rhipicephalus microplus]
MSYGRAPPVIDGMTSLKVDNLTYRTTPDDLKRVFESATAKTRWTRWTATSWTAANFACRWRATLGLPTRTANPRRPTTARQVAGHARAAAAAAGRGAAGDQGPGHVDDRGAVLGRGDTVQDPDLEGPEADQGIAGVLEAKPGKAAAEAGERAAVVAGARAAASQGSGAALDASRERPQPPKSRERSSSKHRSRPKSKGRSRSKKRSESKEQSPTHKRSAERTSGPVQSRSPRRSGSLAQGESDEAGREKFRSGDRSRFKSQDSN